MEPLSSWPSWISARVRSHSRLGPECHTGHLITNVLARPFSISSFRLADLSGKANSCFRDQLEPSAIPLVNLSVLISGCCLGKARFIAALLCQHGPSDPRQLVGESRGQNVRMQAHSGASEPDPEAVLRPVRRPQQNDPGCLHEEHAQVTVAALGDASEDGSVSGRHLLRDETEPSRKVPPFRECRATTDRGNHRTRNDRANARHGHDPSTTVITFCQRLDLIGHGFNSPIELPPVAGKIARVHTMRGERTSVRLARMSGNTWRRKRSPCRTMVPRSRRKPRI